MIDTICIGGGGIKGLSFISTLQFLEKKNYINLNKINKFTGISAGSILCLLIIIGFTISELIDLFENYNYNDIIDNFDLDLDIIIDDFGFDNCNNIMDTLKKIIIKKNNLITDDLTFIELYNLTKKEFYIGTTNFTKGIEENFSYINSPNMSIYLAIRMSISIPIIFTPLFYNNQYYFDGNVKNNILLLNFDPNKTLVLYVKNDKINKVETIIDIINGSINILINQINLKKLKLFKCVNINNYSKNLIIDKNIINKKIIHDLYFNGIISAKKFLKNELKKKINNLKNKIIYKTNNIIKNILHNIINTIESK